MTRTLGSSVEALLLARGGELTRAEELARAAIVIAETETDNVWLHGWSNEDLALVLERAGRIEEARDALERALAVWERKRCLPYVARAREQLDALRAGAGLSHAQGTFPHTRAAGDQSPELAATGRDVSSGG